MNLKLKLYYSNKIILVYISLLGYNTEINLHFALQYGCLSIAASDSLYVGLSWDVIDYEI